MYAPPAFFTQAFVPPEVYSPRNATQGGAVVFMLNQPQAGTLQTTRRFDLKVLSAKGGAGWDECL